MEIQTPTRAILIALLVSSLFIGISWAALIPMWHTPDEQAHFAQAQDIAAIGHRPNPGNSTSADIIRSEELLGTLRENGNNQFTYHPEYRIPYSKTTEGIFEEEIKNFPASMRMEFITNEATGYPPFYYWIIARVNRVFWDQNLITRVFLSRIATVALSTVGIYVVYLLAHEVFRSSFFALISASLVSFHPMWRFVGAGVTSDALMNLMVPLLFLAFFHFLQSRSHVRLALLLMVMMVSLLTKLQTALFILPGLLFLGYLAVNGPRRLEKSMRLVIFTLMFMSILLLGIASLRHTRYSVTVAMYFPDWLAFPEIGHFSSLLNRPTFVEYLQTTSVEMYRQTFPWYWGVYRWLSLTLPLWTYRVIKVVILVSILGWVIGLFRRQLSFTLHASRFTLLAVSSATYAVGLLTWNFFFWKSQGFPIGIQGRYFFPNLPEHMIFLLVGILLVVPASLRKLSGILTVTMMLFFHWYSLWFVSGSYYDTTSLSVFFIQASQYKPWFFKLPWLPIWVGAGLVTSLVFLFALGYHLLKRPGPAATNLKKDCP